MFPANMANVLPKATDTEAKTFSSEFPMTTTSPEGVPVGVPSVM
jgi:hypothetical protein